MTERCFASTAVLVLGIASAGCISLTDEEFDDLSTDYALVQVNGMRVDGQEIAVGEYRLESGGICVPRVVGGTLQLDARFSGFDLRLAVLDPCREEASVELHDGGAYASAADSIAFTSGTGVLGMSAAARIERVLRIPASLPAAGPAEPMSLPLELVFREVPRQ